MNWFWIGVVTISVLIASSWWAGLELRHNPGRRGLDHDLGTGHPLRTAPKGTLRSESVQAVHVKRTILQYQRAGWMVTEQLCTTALGSRSPEFTIIFRKL